MIMNQSSYHIHFKQNHEFFELGVNKPGKSARVTLSDLKATQRWTEIRAVRLREVEKNEELQMPVHQWRHYALPSFESRHRGHSSQRRAEQSSHPSMQAENVFLEIISLLNFLDKRIPLFQCLRMP